MTNIVWAFLLPLLGLSPVEWQRVQSSLAARVPSLAEARVRLLAPDRLRLELPAPTPLDDESYDELLRLLAPFLGPREILVEVRGPAGEDLRPAREDAATVARLVSGWRAARPSAAPHPLTPVPLAGILAGRRIALSASHGMRWSAGAWAYQRDPFNHLQEDLHTNEIVFRHLAPMLERAGAQVVLLREPSTYGARVVADNDAGACAGGGTYNESGAWASDGGVGHGGTARYADVSSQETARASFRFDVAKPVELPVYVWFLAGTNRATDAHFIVEHASGATTVLVDQSRGGWRWVYLGTFAFVPGGPAAVHLTNVSARTSKVVIADAVRLGGGAGFADFGGGISGVARWQQSASMYAVEEEVPPSAFDATNDVTTRPRISLWQGVDLFLSLHTNGSLDHLARGTTSFIYSNAVAWPNFDAQRATPVPPGTKELQDAVHAAVLEVVRARWSPAWTDKGELAGDFGELRPITEAWSLDPTVVVPAMLLELAFHDNGADAAFLREDAFRRDLARGMLRGIVRHVRGPSAVTPPLPPEHVSARVSPAGIRVAWKAAVDTLEPAALPTSYEVELSSDGRTFAAPIPTSNTELEVPGLTTCGMVAARVSAVSASGRSLPSAVAFARVLPGAPRVLWVDGQKRLVRTVEESPDGPQTAARLLGDLALAHGGDVELESAPAAMVSSGELALAGYDLVVWTAAESSRAVRSDTPALDAIEQAALSAYVAGGGALVLSGAEVGYDLAMLGSSADQTFVRDVLHADYVSDDAGCFDAAPSTTAVWLAGLDPLFFDDGTGESYRVEYPDVLAPGTGARAELHYSTGGVAAVAYDAATRLFFAGFPLETLEDDALRAVLFDRLLAGMLGAAVPPTCGEPYGSGPADGADSGGGDGGDSGDGGDGIAGGDGSSEADTSGPDSPRGGGRPSRFCGMSTASAQVLAALLLPVAWRRRRRGATGR